MKLALGMWASFMFVWFVCETVDKFWPPHNPVFNAAVALGAMMVFFAQRITERS